jgi:hypothetical protein
MRYGQQLSALLVVLLLACLPAAHGQADGSELLGQDFFLSFGGSFQFIPAQAQATCPILYQVLLTCVEDECLDFVNLCPVSNLNLQDSASQGELFRIEY